MTLLVSDNQRVRTQSQCSSLASICTRWTVRYAFDPDHGDRAVAIRAGCVDRELMGLPKRPTMSAGGTAFLMVGSVLKTIAELDPDSQNVGLGTGYLAKIMLNASHRTN
jgi:hypothetical protein